MSDMTPAEMLEAALNGELEPHKEPKKEPNAEPPQNSSDDEPVGAPIASKSGTYTIPYEKLEKAREKAHTLEAENVALKARLDAMQQSNLSDAQAAASMREATGKVPTQADSNLALAEHAVDQGVDVSLFGDFSEEAIAKGVAALQARASGAIRAELRAELARELEPIRKQRAESEENAHYGPIYAKHPDADEFVQSAEFEKWKGALPSFIRAGVEAAMENGSSAQVIEVFDAFKTQTGSAKSPEVQRRVPNSLSEITGEPHRDLVQQTLETAASPGALLDAMGKMTPEQLERVLNAV